MTNPLNDVLYLTKILGF